ncbi:MAG: Clp protease ClpP [Ruminococcus sp.]
MIVSKTLSFGGKNSGYMTLSNANDSGKAVLNLYGDICGSMWDKWMSDDTCPQDVSDFLAQVDENAPLEMHINSGGGSVFGGLAIYSLIKRHSGETTAYIDGLAASIASVIPLACDKVVIMSEAQYMIHKPLMCIGGNADDLRASAELLDKAQESITNIYMTRVKDGITRDYISAMINAETWKTGKEAADIFDFEVEDVAEIAACTSDMLSRYKSVPETLKVKSKTTDNTKIKEKEKLQLWADSYKARLL